MLQLYLAPMREPTTLASYTVLSRLCGTRPHALPGLRAYKVGDPSTERLFVAKRFSANGEHAEGVLRHLRLQFRAASRIEHPSLVGFTALDGPYHDLLLSRPFVEGRTLEELYASDQPAQVETLVAALAEVLLALAKLHDHGLAHGALSPSNVILNAAGRTVLTDQLLNGAALRRLLWPQAPRPDNPCLAAEEELGMAPDARSDLYAFGVLLYRALSGSYPGNDADPVARLSVRREANAAADPPRPLATLLRRLLDPDPRRRYGRADEALADLQGALRELEPRKRATAEVERIVAQRVFERALGKGNLVCPRLVGREAESMRLLQHMNAALGGRGGFVLVRGESGVGKTRLVSDALKYARLKRMRPLLGGATEDDSQPYGVVRAALEALTLELRGAATQTLSDVLGPEAGALLDVLPGLAEVPAWAALAEPPPASHETRRYRIQVAAARLFAAAARRRPTVLALDDLQWADKPSLDLVAHLVRTVVKPDTETDDAAPLIIVATVRDDELVGDGPFLRQLALLRQAEILRLRKLDPRGIEEMIEAMLGRRVVTAELSEYVLREAEGNPLFVEETLRAMADDGVLTRGPEGWTVNPEGLVKSVRPVEVDATGLGVVKLPSLPQSVVTVYQRRLASLEPVDRRVVETAAVLGVSFGFEHLARAVKLDEDTLLDVLDAHAKKNLIEETPGNADLFRFSHPKVRDVVLALAVPDRLRHIHGDVLRALEDAPPCEDGEARGLSLAHHAYRSGDAHKAITYLPPAARLLKDKGSLLEALHQWKRLLGTLSGLPRSERQKLASLRTTALAESAELLLEVGHASDAADRFREVANIALEEHLEEARIIGLNGLARTLLSGGNAAEAERLALEAQALASQGGKQRALAESLKTLGQTAMTVDRYRHAVTHLAEAAQLCTKLGDALSLAQIANLNGNALALGGETRLARSSYEQALAGFRELGDRRGTALALHNLGALALRQGDYAQALKLHDECLKLRRTLEGGTALAETLLQLAHNHLHRGDAARAVEFVDEAIEVQRGHSDARADAAMLTLRGLAQIELGQALAAATLHEALKRSQASAHLPTEAAAKLALAQALGVAGAADKALVLAHAAADDAQRTGDALLLTRARLVVAELARSAHAHEAAQEALAMARKLGEHELEMRAETRLARLARLDSRQDAARAHYLRALELVAALSTAAGAPTCFWQRRDVQTLLRDSGEFFSFSDGIGGAELAKRIPVLNHARVAVPA